MGRPRRKIEITSAQDDQLREMELSETFHPKVRLRARVLRLHAQGWSVAQLAAYFDRNHQAVHDDLTRFEHQGFAGLSDGRSTGQPTRMTPAMEQFLHEKLQEDRLWTAPLLQTALQEGCGAKISQRALNNHLHRLGYSWKRARYSPAKPLDPNVRAEHAASIETLKKGRWTANSP